MFAVERYVTNALLAVLDQYVQDLEPKDAQVSLWSGGVALHNLVLRPDVVQRALNLPVAVTSGRIHELLVQVPWMKIVSEPVQVTINTMECVLSLKEDPNKKQETSSSSHENKDYHVNEEEAPPGYVTALVRRVVSNISVRVHRLILKLIEDDTVLSLNIESLEIDSADALWNAAFTDVEATGVARRLVRLRDLTLCLDKRSAAGNIRDYQEPLLYRCDLLFRVTRQRTGARSAYTHIALECEKLQLGVSHAQLPMLHRLTQALAAAREKAASTNESANYTRSSNVNNQYVFTSDDADIQGWSAWAWSWVPSGVWGAEEKQGGSEATMTEVSAPARTLIFTVIVHMLIFSFKTTERTDASTKRVRGVLRVLLERAGLAMRSREAELESHVVLRTGAKGLCVESEGACVCGRPTSDDKREVYYKSLEAENVPEHTVEEELEDWPSVTARGADNEGADEEQAAKEACPAIAITYTKEVRHVDHSSYSNLLIGNDEDEETVCERVESLLEEECHVNVSIGSAELTASAGFLHRVRYLLDVDFSTRASNEARPEPPNTCLRRVHLTWNLPQLRLLSLEHTTDQHHLHLDVEATKITAELDEPLYRHRDQRAVSARRRLSVEIIDARALLARSREDFVAIQTEVPGKEATSGAMLRAPVARLSARLFVTILLDPHLDRPGEPVIEAYTLRIKEAAVYGSAARLHTAYIFVRLALANLQLLSSPQISHICKQLAYSALQDRDAVHLDAVLEEAVLRSYHTRNIHTHIFVLESSRATVLHAQPQKHIIEQAWIFSAPDIATTSPFLRAAVQYCDKLDKAGVLQYAGLWCEPVSVSLDPLVSAWLGGWLVRPLHTRPCHITDTPATNTTNVSSATRSILHRRTDLLSRSHSSGERETLLSQPARPPERKNRYSGEWLLAVLRSLCASADLGSLTLYAPTETISALDCPSLRAAVERHAATASSPAASIIALSVGRVNAYSKSSSTKLWRIVRQDGPTILPPNPEIVTCYRRDSFPWKLHLSDIWCYTLTVASTRQTTESSRLRMTTLATTVIEPITTTVTLSILTERATDPETTEKNSTIDAARSEKVDYFVGGEKFEPKTLNQFIHGPSRKEEHTDYLSFEPQNPQIEIKVKERMVSRQSSDDIPWGRVVGACVHADTSPLIMEVHSDQVESLYAAVHSFSHLVELFNTSPSKLPAQLSCCASRRSSEWLRATTETSATSVPLNTTGETPDLLLIFDRPHTEWRVTVWVQWVVARVSLRYELGTDRLTLDAEEMSASADLQRDYCQYKVKISGAEVWVATKGPEGRWRCTEEAGGRVLRARSEVSQEQAVPGLLGLTVTAVTSSSLRSKYAHELPLHVVRAESNLRHRSRIKKNESSKVWEAALSVASLEVVLNAALLSRFICSATAAPAPPPLCSIQEVPQPSCKQPVPWICPLVYVDWGGARVLLLANSMLEQERQDVTVIEIHQLSVNPNPDNPIGRQTLRSDAPSVYNLAPWWESSYDRQYSVMLKGVAIYTATWYELEDARATAAVANENPARAWSVRGIAPAPTPLLHPASLHAILAPRTSLYTAAAEISMLEDLTIHICTPQLHLLLTIAKEFVQAYVDIVEATLAMTNTSSTCMFVPASVNLVEVGTSTAPHLVDSGCDSVPDDTSSNSLSSSRPSVTTETGGGGEVYITARALNATLYEQIGSKMIALLHARLIQPSVFLIRREVTSPMNTPSTSYQISLYDLWLGCAQDETASRVVTTMSEESTSVTFEPVELPGAEACPLALLDTGKGIPDPVTHIRPALLTIRAQDDCGARNGRMHIKVVVDRPLRLQLCEIRARRIRELRHLVYTAPDPTTKFQNISFSRFKQTQDGILLKRLHRTLIGVESVEVTTSQLVACLACSWGVAVGVTALEAKLSAQSRPDTIVMRGLVEAMAASAPTALEESKERTYLLHPITFGLQATAVWEPWRQRCEPGSYYTMSSITCGSGDSCGIRVLIEAGCITLEAAPHHAIVLRNTIERLKTVSETALQSFTQEQYMTASDNGPKADEMDEDGPLQQHFFKDDLRNGAFKVSTELQDSTNPPMAYQVIVGADTLTWRYPHPRSLTRVLICPMPLAQEDECPSIRELTAAVEFYCEVTSEFQQLGYMTLRETETSELRLRLKQACWSDVWRVRLTTPSERISATPVVLRCQPAFDPLQYSITPPTPLKRSASRISSQGDNVMTLALAGALRVDSCQAERAVPRFSVTARSTGVEIRIRTAASPDCGAEPLRRAYTGIMVHADHTAIHLRIAPSATTIAGELTVRALLLEPDTLQTRLVLYPARIRTHCFRQRRPCRANTVHAHVDSLHVSLAPHYVKLLRRLSRQWTEGLKTYCRGVDQEDALWLHYWLYNRTERLVQIGQLGTRECLNFAPGTHMVYAWRSAHTPKQLMIALPERQSSLETVELDVEGHQTLRLEQDNDTALSTHAHVTVRARPNGSLQLSLTGRLLLANTMQKTFHYKVRVKSEQSGSQTICGGMLPASFADCTALCPDAHADQLYIKFKLADFNASTNKSGNWTGDVPLRECPDRNSPWLVKVPCGGELEYFCIWCRIVRPSPPDSRVLVMLWPLYLVTSELPLEVFVHAASTDAKGEKAVAEEQLMKGRGASTSLIVPGTTHTKHQLYFRYKDFKTRVTRESIPLHYSLAAEPVLAKPAVNKDHCDIETLLQSVRSWLARQKGGVEALELEDEEDEESDTVWPYSLVMRHLAGGWMPSSMPPNTNITVDYKRVDAGAAGCSLELQIRPQSLFCNASSRIITLRARDFTHLCTIHPGQVIAPPHNFPQEEGWMLSVETDELARWMSAGMSVARAARGHYERGPPGEVAPDRPTLLHIVSPSKDNVILLSLYYEIHQGMEVVGVSTTHLIRNLTSQILLVCGVAVWSPSECEESFEPVCIWPKASDYVSILPHSESSPDSTALDMFITRGTMEASVFGGGRWRSYLCLALLKLGQNEDQEHDETNFVPLCLDVIAPARKTIALRTRDQTFKSFSATIQKLRTDQDGRTLVEIGQEKHAEFVVKNLTKLHIVIASTQSTGMEPEEECAGVMWQRHVPSGASLEYSSPSYCSWLSRCDPDAPMPKPCVLLTACTLRTEWGCVDPYADLGGPLLIRVACDTHIKVTVQRRSLDTIITIHHVDKNDISARDIRQRLVSGGPVPEITSLTTLMKDRSNETEIENNQDVCDESVVCLLEESSDTSTDGGWKYEVAVHSAVLMLGEPRGDANVLVLHFDILRLALRAGKQGMEAQLSALDLQVDNAQFDRSDTLYDFPVVLVGQGVPESRDNALPTLWDLAIELSDPNIDRITIDLSMIWHSGPNEKTEIRLVEVRANQLSVYIEDRFLANLLPYVDQFRWAEHCCALCVRPSPEDNAIVSRHALQLSKELRNPMRIHSLILHSLPLLLNLHTSTWLYVALDHSPLNLSEFRRTDIAARPSRFIRALAYHYLSGAIFGAGWVVGGLEVLGAPGTLVRRVGEGLRALTAGGGAGALCGSLAAGALQSLAALCSSLARNLDLLAGDEQHIVRAAAQRRRRPRNFPQAVITGLTGLAAGLLSGLGGLARSPLTGPRAALLGMVTKPLSATADLVAMSSQGLLYQAGWDVCPQARASSSLARAVCVETTGEETLAVGQEPVLYACRVHVHGHSRLLLLVLAAERLILVGDFEELVENLELNRLELTPARTHTHLHADAHIVHVDVKQVQVPPPALTVRRPTQDDPDAEFEDTPDYEAREAALARVARFTGAAGSGTAPRRTLRLRTPSAAHAHQLRSHLTALLQRPQSGFKLV